MKIDNGVTWLADGYRYKLFEEKEFKDKKISPSDKDNFILVPKDDPETFVEFDVGGQTTEVPHKVKPTQRRIKSASSVRLQDRPWRQAPKPKYPEGFVPRSRPASALTPKTRVPSSANTPRRIKSAGPSRTYAESVARETVEELRKGFALVNKLYENDYKSLNVRLHPASPAPDYRYFDRHSRCYNHTHAHKRPYTDRPQRACELFLESCGSRAVSPARPDDPNVQPQRYIDYHRPRTAPGTRRELQYIPRASYVYRGHAPHFCNFVQQVSLHNRQDNGTNSTGIPDSEFDDADFILESADGRMINKYRKSSTARNNKDIQNWLADKKTNKVLFHKYFSSIPEIKEDTLPSGTEGRPGSPSSLDGDSQQDLDGQQPVTGIAHAGSMIPEEDVSHKEQTTSTPVGWENTEGLNSYKEPVDNVAGVSDSNNRIPSPRQPPPSPEPVKQKSKKLPPEVPLPVTAAETTKKRSCVSKKTKKPVERKRKMKQIEEVKPPEPIKTEEAPPPETTTNQNETVTSKVDLKVPDLPSNLDNKDKQRKEKSKVKKHLIEIEDDLLRPDANEILNEQMKLNRTEFDWSNMDTNGTEDVKRQPQIKSWIQGRLALSQQSSRFELPMDMKNLEKMTPQEYIRKHCIITSRRQNLYQKIFLKNKDKTQAILYKDLDRSLKDVLVNTITSDQIQEVLHTLQVDESTKVDYKLFAGMAAYAERVLYPQFVTEDTEGMPEYQREKIECADFCALPWKLHGVNVNPEMKKLLEQIS